MQHVMLDDRMGDVLQEIVIAIASPGGVDAERDAARAVVERLSTSIAPRLGCTLRVVMWEDVPPGFGRPQSRINERLDDANLFIGIVHRRWGTPTGPFSSGFEEEFSRASDRRRAEGTPELQLYLKNVSSELLEDPGRQLEQVLAFKQRVEAKGELLYKAFPDTATFATTLSDAIVAHLIDSENSRTADRADALRRQADAAGVEERDAAEAAFAAEESKYLLARAINMLSERQKIVVTLLYVYGLTAEELAAVLGTSAAQIGRLHTKAMLALRDSLAASGIQNSWCATNAEGSLM